MTFDALIEKWQKPIGDWAIEKGWMDTTKPRDMLHLLMLMVTELAELEAGVFVEDEANIREEVADFAIRAIQMRAEYGFTHPSGMSLDELLLAHESMFDGDASLMSYVAEAAECWRGKGFVGLDKLHTLWRSLATAIAVMTVEHSYDVDEATGQAADPIKWLDSAIADKMEKNAKRPYRHGKLA